jgi:O-antigen/teichoic acid export membrane protein
MLLGIIYVGPGLGAGVVATVIGVIGSIFLAIFGVVWYPVKRMIRRWRSRHAGESRKVPGTPAPEEG